MKPVVRLLKTKLTLDGYKANLAISLWSTVQQKVYQLPFFFLGAGYCRSKYRIKSENMPLRVCSEAGQQPCCDTDLLSSSNLKFFTIQLASTQHKMTPFSRGN